MADKLGQIVELLGQNPEDQKNMDLWNNGVGRKKGKQSKSKEELCELLKKALQNGELIITPNDSQKYKKAQKIQFNIKRPVLVVGKSKRGRNEFFIDTQTRSLMDRESFVRGIKNREYPGYNVTLINGIDTPVSKPDKNRWNNLG